MRGIRTPMREGLERMKKLVILSRTRLRFANVHEQAVASPLRRRRLWTTLACRTLAPAVQSLQTTLRPACHTDRTLLHPSRNITLGFQKRATWTRHPFDHGLHRALTGDSVPKHALRVARHATATMNPQRVHQDGRPRVYRSHGEGQPFGDTSNTCRSATKERAFLAVPFSVRDEHTGAHGSGRAPISLP
ncbi:hypothetical protein Mapa_007214 [Marchantia paleacea]|nr:hypothetical protein Mapa_007214 [Marchantia paleacea]